MKAGLGDNVYLNGRVTAGVVDGASVDLRDRHDGIGWESQSVEERRKSGGQINGSSPSR